MTKLVDQAIRALLRDTSRSFYLTLRILPRRVRPQISLAYLLARISDTIVDTTVGALQERFQALQEFAAQVQGTSHELLDLSALAKLQREPAEEYLLQHVLAPLAYLEQLQESDRRRVREVLATILSGQELDLKRFAYASENTVINIASANELDDYTYRVAGCVGEFWTHICQENLEINVGLPDDEFLEKAVQFGKGLQLVNILRDLPADLRIGRCYFPRDALNEVDLSATDLLKPENMEPFRPIFMRHCRQAKSFLDDARDYVDALPWRQFRLRLACMWPVVIGFQTLRALQNANILDPKKRVKITRKQVRRILLMSLLGVISKSVFRRWMFRESEACSA